MCLGFIQNYAGFMTVRALLGAAEGGLLPGIVGSLPNYSRQDLNAVEGSISVWNVHARRNGFQNWSILYQRISIRLIRRFVSATSQF